SGSITSICFMLGAVAKYFHLPGAGAMIVAAIVVFSFLFLPVMITLKLKESPENRHKAVLILGLITGILGSMSVLFKLMWWPGANVLWMTSLVSLLLLFLPAYFFTGFRNPVLKTNTIVTTILLLAGGAMMFSLTSLTTSNSSSIAIDNMEVLLSANLQQLNERNEALLKAIASLPVANDAITALPELTSTRAMLAYLQNMRAGLISKIENMPLEKAMKTRVNELPNSKNWSQVKSILTNVPELSQKTLIENVNKYNQSIAGNRSLCPLVISNNDFRNTQLHYVIHVLNQLSCQAETNRQAILTYHLGKFQNHI
ncbi:MAG TPA: hypothetical protein PLU53_03765, partial [Bacteroidia bacterium]|nr:hypothetical protein [Bacteroidia bacterium]